MDKRYVLITPAKNEEKQIRKTIESVISQTIPPLRWIMVNDNSTDRTGKIIESYSRKFKFITLVQNESNVKKDFSSKVLAFNKGYKILNKAQYSFLGNLDADVSFGPAYYEQILKRMSIEPGLGIAGGLIYEIYAGQTKAIDTSLNSVSGAVQFFRKECLQEIGGYIPLRGGGIDSAAEICARAHGWDVKTFPDLQIFHHGRILTGKSRPLQTMFQKGLNSYILGYHPFFQFVSSIRRMKHPPFFLGGLFCFFGYIYGKLNKCSHALPPGTVKFLRNEQLTRLRNLFPV